MPVARAVPREWAGERQQPGDAPAEQVERPGGERQGLVAHQQPVGGYRRNDRRRWCIRFALLRLAERQRDRLHEAPHPARSRKRRRLCELRPAQCRPTSSSSWRMVSIPWRRP